MGSHNPEDIDLYTFLLTKSGCVRVKNFLNRLEQTGSESWGASKTTVEIWKNLPVTEIAKSKPLQEYVRESLLLLPSIGANAAEQVIEEITLSVCPKEHTEDDRAFSVLDLCLISSSIRVRNRFTEESVSPETLELLGSLPAYKILDNYTVQRAIQNLQGLGAGSVETLQDDYERFTSTAGVLLNSKKDELNQIKVTRDRGSHSTPLTDSGTKVELVQVDTLLEAVESADKKLAIHSQIAINLMQSLTSKRATPLLFEKEAFHKSICNSKFSNWLANKAFLKGIGEKSLLDVALSFERLGVRLESIAGWGRTKTGALFDFILEQIFKQIDKQDLLQSGVSATKETGKLNLIEKKTLIQQDNTPLYQVEKFEITDASSRFEIAARTTMARDISQSLESIVTCCPGDALECKISLQSAIENSNMRHWLANKDFNTLTSQFSLLGFCLSINRELIYEFEAIKGWGATKTAQLFKIALESLAYDMTSSLKIESVRQSVSLMDDSSAARELLSLAGLSERNILIIELRSTSSQTLEEIGKSFGTTRERVRQICLKVQSIPNYVVSLARSEVAARSSRWTLDHNQMITGGGAFLCTVAGLSIKDASSELKDKGSIPSSRPTEPD